MTKELGASGLAPGLAVVDNQMLAVGGDGAALTILALHCEERIVSSSMLQNVLQTG